MQTNLRVGFIAPAVAAASGPGIPLLNLAATITDGGSLQGGQTLYYAVAGWMNRGMRALSALLCARSP